MDTFTNSEDPDEMPHDAAFQQVYTVKVKDLQFKIVTGHLKYIQWTIPSMMHQARRKNLLLYRGLSDYSNGYAQLSTIF